MKAVVFNLGCKVNQYECDAIAGSLTDLGYEVTEELTEADLYIVNTCAVTAEAERKSRQCLSRIRKKNPLAEILVMGCASQKNAEFYREQGVGAFGVYDRKSLLACLESGTLPEKTALPAKDFEELGVPQGDRTRAYIKIQDGCNRFCSYCIIPYLRGRSRSRKLASVVKEAEILAKRTPELVLTGINMAEYGKDTGETLPQLVEALKPLKVRIRLGSFYVEGIDGELLEKLRGLYEFCPQFHLSLQHGDAEVLKDMNRKYTPEDYERKVALIRKYFPNSAVTADIIVGYPTETEEAFRNTVDFVRRVGFADLHVFPFSPREGTEAYALPRVPSDMVARRKTELDKVRQELRKAFVATDMGARRVVWETQDTEGNLWGYDQYYVRCCACGDVRKLHTVTDFLPETAENEILKGDISL